MMLKDRLEMQNNKGWKGMTQTWRDTKEKLWDIGRCGNILGIYPSGHPYRSLSSVFVLVLLLGYSLVKKNVQSTVVGNPNASMIRVSHNFSPVTQYAATLLSTNWMLWLTYGNQLVWLPAVVSCQSWLGTNIGLLTWRRNFFHPQWVNVSHTQCAPCFLCPVCAGRGCSPL